MVFPNCVRWEWRLYRTHHKHKWPLASSAHTPSADLTLSADGNKSELLIHNNYSVRNVAAIIATSIQIMPSLQISASADCQNTHHTNRTLNPPGHSIGCQNQHPHFGKCKLEGGEAPPPAGSDTNYMAMIQEWRYEVLRYSGISGFN